MIEHTGLHCSDFKKSVSFYKKALAPLGYRNSMTYGENAGFAADGHTSFFVGKAEVGAPIHLAFRAKDRKTVDAFHKAALKAGGTDNGPPGLRKDYSPTYYAAFVRDPDGHNIEAVTFVRGPSGKKGGAQKKSSETQRTARKR